MTARCGARVALYGETGVYADRYKDRPCRNPEVEGTGYCRAHQRYAVPTMDRAAFEDLRNRLFGDC